MSRWSETPGPRTWLSPVVHRALLFESLRTLHDPVRAARHWPGCNVAHLVREEVAWVEGHRRGLYSFTECCAAVGLDAGALRTRLRRAGLLSPLVALRRAA